jgi:hypothetical protein
MAEKSERVVLHSIHSKEGWIVKEEGRDAPRSFHDTQADCESEAVTRAKGIYEKGGLSQVIFHKESGEIREEHTYGEDPRRHPG